MNKRQNPQSLNHQWCHGGRLGHVEVVGTMINMPVWDTSFSRSCNWEVLLVIAIMSNVQQTCKVKLGASYTKCLHIRTCLFSGMLCLKFLHYKNRMVANGYSFWTLILPLLPKNNKTAFLIYLINVFGESVSATITFNTSKYVLSGSTHFMRSISIYNSVSFNAAKYLDFQSSFKF